VAVARKKRKLKPRSERLPEDLPNRGNVSAIDLSPSMITQLQKRIVDAGLQNITAQCLDIFKNPPAGPFDLIFSAMALHHVPDTDALLDRLAGLIKPSGWIALVDLDIEDGTSEPIYYGFAREELMQKLRACGFCETAAATAHVMHKNGRDHCVFLVTARKTAE
jgi:trans-aconitate methyltransferase